MSTLAQLLMGVGVEAVPTAPGTPFEGGYYAGKIKIGNQEYALVVAPKSQGGQSPTALQWKTSNTTTANTNSINDGKANTAAMIAAGASVHPAASFCNSLEINGYTDWYLPAKDELEMLYRAFKPTTEQNYTGRYWVSGVNTSSIPPGANYWPGGPAQTSVEIFREGGSEAFDAAMYWSSTHYPQNVQYSWNQNFNYGRQNTYTKISAFSVRAVRRVLL